MACLLPIDAMSIAALLVCEAMSQERTVAADTAHQTELVRYKARKDLLKAFPVIQAAVAAAVVAGPDAVKNDALVMKPDWTEIVASPQWAALVTAEKVYTIARDRLKKTHDMSYDCWDKKSALVQALNVRPDSFVDGPL